MRMILKWHPIPNSAAADTFEYLYDALIMVTQKLFSDAVAHLEYEGAIHPADPSNR